MFLRLSIRASLPDGQGLGHEQRKVALMNMRNPTISQQAWDAVQHRHLHCQGDGYEGSSIGPASKQAWMGRGRQPARPSMVMSGRCICCQRQVSERISWLPTNYAEFSNRVEEQHIG
jgi:hypothetical protein